MTLSNEAQARLDAHLDAVEKALRAANCTRDQRRGVVDDLGSQIQEMLARRSLDPTLVHLEAVLAELDPPSTYGIPSPPQSRNGASEPAQIATSRAVLPSSATDRQHPTPKSLKRSFFMRSSVLVTLIICGTFLVMSPAIADYFKDRENAHISQTAAEIFIKRQDITHVATYRPEPLQDTLKFGMWCTGSIAIAMGALGGFVAYWHETRR